MEDASRKGRIAQAKLSVALVVVIRQEAAEGMTYAALARKYGVGEGPIARVVKRKSYAHVA
jgi:Mor family transcriptional regulator